MNKRKAFPKKLYKLKKKCFPNASKTAFSSQPRIGLISQPRVGFCGASERCFSMVSKKGLKNPTVVRQATRPWLGYLSDRGRVENTAK